jgi:hypothetical protein
MDVYVFDFIEPSLGSACLTSADDPDSDGDATAITFDAERLAADTLLCGVQRILLHWR